MNTRENPIERPIALFYIAKTDVASITINNGNASLTPSSGKNWSQIYLTPGTINFTQTPGDSKGGRFYDVELSGTAPGEGDNFIQDLDLVTGRQNYFKIDFRNGSSKLFGNSDRLPLCDVGIISKVVTQKSISIKQRVLQPLPWLV